MSRTSLLPSVILTLSVGVSGCLPSPDLGPGEGSRTVTGIRQRTYSPPGLDRFDLPAELSLSTVRAFLEASDGGYGPPLTVSAGTGTFEVKNIPASARYLLQVEGVSIVDSADAVDLSELVPGRAGLGDYDLTDPSPATLTLNLGGLAAWSGQSGLEIVSAGANSWAFLGALRCPLPTSIADGAVSLTGWQIDLKHYQFCGGNHPIEGTRRKDRVVVAQLEPATSTGGASYLHMTRYLVAPPFDLADGQEQVIEGTMTVAADVRSLSCDVRSSRFAERFPTAVEGLIDGTLVAELDVLGLPIPTTLGIVDSSSADFLLASLPPSTDVTTGLMTYAKAYADQFSPLALVRWSRRVQVALPGANPVVVATSFLASWLDEAALCSAPVEPGLGFVEELAISGRDALRAQNDVGTDPVLSWSAPSLGSAQRYSVRLLALGAQSTAGGGLTTTATVVGDYRVRGTNLRIPRGVLATGTSYVAVVTATTSPGLIEVLPAHQSSLVSSPFSP